MLSLIFAGMENMETLLLTPIIQINKRGTVKSLVYHCKIKRFLMVLSYSVNHGLMSQNLIRSGTTWEDCDKYARCGNFGELKRLKAKYPHLKQLFLLVAGLGLTAFLTWPLMKKQEKYSLNLQ